MFENNMWLFAVAGGLIILSLVVAYALLTKRRRGQAESRETDRATREVYRNHPK